MARIVALAIVVVLAAVPAAALAASSQPLLQDAATQQAPAPAPVQQAPVQTEANSGSIGAADLVLIALGIGALIGGIWFAIARDARRMTAGRTRRADGEIGAGRGGSATRPARRSRKLSAAEKQRRKRGRAH